MKGKRLTAALAAMLALVAVGAGTAAATGRSRPTTTTRTERAFDRRPARPATPKNVIFLLGDGMGTQEITAARYYQGVSNELNVDRMPFTGFDTTWSVKPAASAALPARLRPRLGLDRDEWATGQKTLDERISQGPSSAIDVPGKNLKTVLELAQKTGMKVGDVSTAEITDATPAVLASHISLRGCQGPADMAACPLETKARRRPRLDRRAGGRPQGRRAARRRSRPLRADDHRRPRRRQDGGPVGPGQGLPVRHRRRRPQHGRRTPTSRCSACSTPATCRWSGPARPPRLGKGNAPVACTEGQRPANEPSLAAMTRQAIDLLDDDKRKGFFLQVEGASIDKQDHATNACGQIGETVAFDRAIGVALDYQRRPPGHAGRRHRRSLAHQPDRRRGRDRLGPADRLLDQPADQGRPDAEPDLRDRRLRRRRAPRRSRRRRASSTPARSCRSGPAARARSRCSGPTTTPTCSRRWAADLEQARGGGPAHPALLRSAY